MRNVTQLNLTLNTSTNTMNLFETTKQNILILLNTGDVIDIFQSYYQNLSRLHLIFILLQLLSKKFDASDILK